MSTLHPVQLNLKTLPKQEDLVKLIGHDIDSGHHLLGTSRTTRARPVSSCNNPCLTLPTITETIVIDEEEPAISIASASAHLSRCHKEATS